jgi:hypothetical protein
LRGKLLAFLPQSHTRLCHDAVSLSRFSSSLSSSLSLFLLVAFRVTLRNNRVCYQSATAVLCRSTVLRRYRILEVKLSRLSFDQQLARCARCSCNDDPTHAGGRECAQTPRPRRNHLHQTARRKKLTTWPEERADSPGSTFACIFDYPLITLET